MEEINGALKELKNNKAVFKHSLKMLKTMENPENAAPVIYSHSVLKSEDVNEVQNMLETPNRQTENTFKD